MPPTSPWSKLRAWHLLLGLLLLRLLFLPFFCSLYDLAGDESYYWEWGRRPDWGYYSKPPLIGWLMGVVGWASGNQEWGVRLAALMVGTGSLTLLYQLGKRMFNAETGLLVLALAALTPANVALNLFFTIDSPLVLLWSAALLAFWGAVQGPERWTRWLVLSLVMGVGTLSKQMMLVFPVLMVLFAALTKDVRPLLKRPGFWLSVVGALLFMLPVLWWNQQHGWITLEHTKHHFNTKAQADLLDHLVQFVEFPATQAGLFTPLTWFGLLTVSAAALWQWRRLGMKERLLATFSAPALVVFHLLALRQSVNPNWPAVYYLAAMVLLAATWTRASTGLTLWPGFMKLRRPAVVVAAVLTALAYLVPMGLWATRRTGDDKLDPMARIHGWSPAGEAAGRFLAACPRPEQTFLLALGHRENASQFAFYTPQHPRAYRWQPDGVIASQYELWPTPAESVGRDALIVQPSEKPLPRKLERNFTKVEKLGEIHVPLGTTGSRKWQVFLGSGLKEWIATP
ncbi:glycosyltransferase family 39 protein [Verrucomicrobium sp. BvORR106]|uniref:ArnT family glycosyltransferase n=1 Tax=Verrucomicrobium sp. BvORR106 TaxID=1403819 RepID=UPI000571FC07|nr:glycosyltransferase family 39 protein [Verrucomicrobium sp. BvORR106]